MDSAIKQKMEEKRRAIIEHVKHELAGIRTGRASTVLFESLSVNAYGAVTPLKQLASLSVPESRQIVIQPWDTHLISEIEKAILTSNLGLTPTNDGKVIRLTIPQMTEEKRKDMVKIVKKQGEEAKVAIRNLRREVNDEFKRHQKAEGLPEDTAKKFQDEAQKMTDQTIAQIDEIVRKKEEEILQV